MPIALTFWFQKRVSGAIARRLEALAVVDENEVTVLEADVVPWRDAVDSLAANKSLWGTLKSIDFRETSFAGWNDEGLVGAVLGPDDLQRAANQARDYRPSLPAPCMGYLPEGTDIQVLSKPCGHVAGVGQETIFSASLAGYLSRVGATRHVGAVVYRGKVLEGWCRLGIPAWSRVLDEICTEHPSPCTRCGSLLTTGIGMWIARVDAKHSASVSRDELSYGHLGSAHRVLLDQNTTRVVAANFGSGLALSPIYMPGSPRACFVIDVMEYISMKPIPAQWIGWRKRNGV